MRPRDWGARPEDFDPEAVRRTHARLRRLFGPGRYFPLEVRGWDRLPAPPALLVSNHSGGLTVLDAWGLLFAWYARFGPERPLHPAAHELVTGLGVLGRPFSRLGILRAHPEIARRALQSGRDVLVMPGGAEEVFRPYRQRHQVDFHGRQGYVRLAIRAGVPLVPVAHVGAHHTFVVLTRGRRIARALGLARLARAEIWPIHLSLPWGLAPGPLPHLPPPTRLRYRIGAPIPVPRLLPGTEPSQELIDTLDRQVRASIQRMLAAMARERRADRRAPPSRGRTL